MHNLSDPLLRVNAGGVSTKDTGKYPEILAALDPTKRFFRFKESRGSPTQCHVGIAIAANPPADTAHSTIRILDDVGGAKTAHQGRRQFHAAYGKRLLQPLQQARCGVRVFRLQPGRLLLEFGDAQAVRELVGGVHHALHLGGQVLGQQPVTSRRSCLLRRDRVQWRAKRIMGEELLPQSRGEFVGLASGMLADALQNIDQIVIGICLLYTSPSPRD